MAYFPFFVELAGASGLVAGGGKVALRKVEKLLPYGPRLTVIAPRIDEKILAMPGVVCFRRAFEPADLEGKDFAVAARRRPGGESPDFPTVQGEENTG